MVYIIRNIMYNFFSLKFGLSLESCILCQMYNCMKCRTVDSARKRSSTQGGREPWCLGEKQSAKVEDGWTVREEEFQKQGGKPGMVALNRWEAEREKRLVKSKRFGFLWEPEHLVHTNKYKRRPLANVHAVKTVCAWMCVCVSTCENGSELCCKDLCGLLCFQTVRPSLRKRETRVEPGSLRAS